MNKYVELLIFVGLPYIISTLIILPFSTGVHGDVVTNSSAETYISGNYEKDDIPNTQGDTYQGSVQGNYTIYAPYGDEMIAGWIFCNGKFWNFGNSVTIKNADIEFEQNIEYWSGSMFTFNFQQITITGTKGELDGGIPFYFFGLFFCFFGFLIWMFKTYFNKIELKPFHIEAATIPLLIPIYFRLAFSLCYLLLIIFIPIIIYYIYLIKNSKKIQYNSKD